MASIRIWPDAINCLAKKLKRKLACNPLAQIIHIELYLYSLLQHTHTHTQRITLITMQGGNNQKGRKKYSVPLTSLCICLPSFFLLSCFFLSIKYSETLISLEDSQTLNTEQPCSTSEPSSKHERNNTKRRREPTPPSSSHTSILPKKEDRKRFAAVPKTNAAQILLLFYWQVLWLAQTSSAMEIATANSTVQFRIAKG
jgi:hypothetical protein